MKFLPTFVMNSVIGKQYLGNKLHAMTYICNVQLF